MTKFNIIKLTLAAERESVVHTIVKRTVLISFLCCYRSWLVATIWSFWYGSRVSYENLWLCSWVLIVISWGSWRSRSYVYDSGKFYRRCRICPRRTGYSGRVASFLMKEQLLCSCVLTCFVMRMLEELWSYSWGTGA